MFLSLVADGVGPAGDDVVGVLVYGVQDCVELVLIGFPNNVFVFVELCEFVDEKDDRQQGDENEDENDFSEGALHAGIKIRDVL